MKKIDHTEYKTVAHPHKQEGLTIKCTSNHLFTISEGLQCGNCGVLVSEYVPVFTVFTDGTKEQF